MAFRLSINLWTLFQAMKERNTVRVLTPWRWVAVLEALDLDDSSGGLAFPHYTTHILAFTLRALEGAIAQPGWTSADSILPPLRTLLRVINQTIGIGSHVRPMIAMLGAVLSLTSTVVGLADALAPADVAELLDTADQVLNCVRLAGTDPIMVQLLIRSELATDLCRLAEATARGTALPADASKLLAELVRKVRALLQTFFVLDVGHWDCYGRWSLDFSLRDELNAKRSAVTGDANGAVADQQQQDTAMRVITRKRKAQAVDEDHEYEDYLLSLRDSSKQLAVFYKDCGVASHDVYGVPAHRLLCSIVTAMERNRHLPSSPLSLLVLFYDIVLNGYRCGRDSTPLVSTMALSKVAARAQKKAERRRKQAGDATVTEPQTEVLLLMHLITVLKDFCSRVLQDSEEGVFHSLRVLNELLQVAVQRGVYQVSVDLILNNGVFYEFLNSLLASFILPNMLGTTVSDRTKAQGLRCVQTLVLLYHKVVERSLDRLFPLLFTLPVGEAADSVALDLAERLVTVYASANQLDIVLTAICNGLRGVPEVAVDAVYQHPRWLAAMKAVVAATQDVQGPCDAYLHEVNSFVQAELLSRHRGSRRRVQVFELFCSLGVLLAVNLPINASNVGAVRRWCRRLIAEVVAPTFERAVEDVGAKAARLTAATLHLYYHLQMVLERCAEFVVDHVADYVRGSLDAGLLAFSIQGHEGSIDAAAVLKLLAVQRTDSRTLSSLVRYLAMARIVLLHRWIACLEGAQRATAVRAADKGELATCLDTVFGALDVVRPVVDAAVAGTAPLAQHRWDGHLLRVAGPEGEALAAWFLLCSGAPVLARHCSAGQLAAFLTCLLLIHSVAEDEGEGEGQEGGEGAPPGAERPVTFAATTAGLLRSPGFWSTAAVQRALLQRVHRLAEDVTAAAAARGTWAANAVSMRLLRAGAQLVAQASPQFLSSYPEAPRLLAALLDCDAAVTAAAGPDSAPLALPLIARLRAAVVRGLVAGVRPAIPLRANPFRVVGDSYAALAAHVPTPTAPVWQAATAAGESEEEAASSSGAVLRHLRWHVPPPYDFRATSQQLVARLVHPDTKAALEEFLLCTPRDVQLLAEVYRAVLEPLQPHRRNPHPSEGPASLATTPLGWAAFPAMREVLRDLDHGLQQLLTPCVAAWEREAERQRPSGGAEPRRGARLGGRGAAAEAEAEVDDGEGSAAAAPLPPYDYAADQLVALLATVTALNTVMGGVLTAPAAAALRQRLCHLFQDKAALGSLLLKVSPYTAANFMAADYVRATASGSSDAAILFPVSLHGLHPPAGRRLMASAVARDAGTAIFPVLTAALTRSSAQLSRGRPSADPDTVPSLVGLLHYFQVLIREGRVEPQRWAPVGWLLLSLLQTVAVPAGAVAGAGAGEAAERRAAWAQRVQHVVPYDLLEAIVDTLDQFLFHHRKTFTEEERRSSQFASVFFGAAAHLLRFLDGQLTSVATAVKQSAALPSTDVGALCHLAAFLRRRFDHLLRTLAFTAVHLVPQYGVYPSQHPLLGLTLNLLMSAAFNRVAVTAAIQQAVDTAAKSPRDGDLSSLLGPGGPETDTKLVSEVCRAWRVLLELPVELVAHVHVIHFLRTAVQYSDVVKQHRVVLESLLVELLKAKLPEAHQDLLFYSLDNPCKGRFRALMEALEDLRGPQGLERDTASVRR